MGLMTVEFGSKDNVIREGENAGGALDEIDDVSECDDVCSSIAGRVRAS